MPRQEIGDFSGQYPTADMVDAQNIRGNTIFAQVIELAGAGVIRSQDFVSGSTGWAIFGNGAAEFLNVDITGDINATGGTISGSLNVTGTLYTNTADPRILIGGSGGSNGFFFTNSGGSTIASIYSDASGNLNLHSGTGFINQAGISTIDTTIHFFRQQAKFADGSASSPGIHFENDTNTGIFRSGADDGRLAAGGASIAQFTSGRFGPGSDNAISLGGSGLRWTEVFAVNGTINTSDMRYKDELVDPVPGLSFISKLHPFKYTWKSGDDPKVHWGLSAQQINALIGTEGPFREGEILGVAYMEIVPALVVAIQELEARLGEYEQQLNALRS